MIKPLHSKSPSFIGDQKISLSWKEATKPQVTTGTGYEFTTLFQKLEPIRSKLPQNLDYYPISVIFVVFGLSVKVLWDSTRTFTIFHLECHFMMETIWVTNTIEFVLISYKPVILWSLLEYLCYFGRDLSLSDMDQAPPKLL